MVLGSYPALACHGGRSSARRPTVEEIIAPEKLGAWVVEALLIKLVVKANAEAEA